MIDLDQYFQFSPYFAELDTESLLSRSNFLKLFKKVPQPVKDLLLDSDTAEKLASIVSAFNLDRFDVESIALQVRKLVVGEEALSKILDDTAQDLDVSPEITKSIFGYIFREVIAPIVDYVKKAQASMGSSQPEVEVGDLNPNNVIDLRSK